MSVPRNIFIDFFPPHLLLPKSVKICFIFLSFFFFTSSRLRTCQADKKVINNEHFALRDNELLIRNAVKHLSGYYSCVVQFMNSGAKLETPHELINIVGKYHDRTTCVDKWTRCIKRFPFSIKTSSFFYRHLCNIKTIKLETKSLMTGSESPKNEN